MKKFVIQYKTNGRWVLVPSTTIKQYGKCRKGNGFDRAKDALDVILELARSGYTSHDYRIARPDGNRAVHAFTAADMQRWFDQARVDITAPADPLPAAKDDAGVPDPS